MPATTSRNVSSEIAFLARAMKVLSAGRLGRTPRRTRPRGIPFWKVGLLEGGPNVAPCEPLRRGRPRPRYRGLWQHHAVCGRGMKG